MYAQVVNVLTIYKFLSIIKVVNTSLVYKKSCSVFGHSKIKITKELENYLKSTFEMLITQENVKYFYFGGFGEFDDLCHSIITELKNVGADDPVRPKKMKDKITPDIKNIS